jgi:hypothetical protein
MINSECNRLTFELTSLLPSLVSILYSTIIASSFSSANTLSVRVHLEAFIGFDRAVDEANVLQCAHFKSSRSDFKIVMFTNTIQTLNLNLYSTKNSL